MSAFDPTNPIAQLIRKDGRYRFDAYVFVSESLNYAQLRLNTGGRPPVENAAEDEAISETLTGSVAVAHDASDESETDDESDAEEPGDESSPGKVEAVPRETVRPFADLGKLPDDLTEAFESFKLAILRHKSAGWQEVTLEEILGTLEALKELALAPSAD